MFHSRIVQASMNLYGGVCMLLEQVMELRESIVKSGAIKKSDSLFQGAGLVITDYSNVNNEDAGYLLVNSDHAYELSALVFALKDIFSAKIDYLSKYEFYGRLGRAAKTYLQNNPDTELILLAVLDEAIVMAKELEE